MFLFAFLLPFGAMWAGIRVYDKLATKKQDQPAPFHAPSTATLTLPDVAEDHLPEMQRFASPEGDREREALEKKTDQYIFAASAAIGLTVAGMVLPPLRLLSLPLIAYATFPFYRAGFKSLWQERRISAYVVDIFFFTGTMATGYFFAASLLSWLLNIGQKIGLQTEAKSRKSLINIFADQPHFVWVQRDEVEIEIPFEDLQLSDLVVVQTGNIIPVDGTIASGVASIDQHLLTGESQPAEKAPGDLVFASTIVLSGKIYITVEQSGADTVIAQIGDILRRTIAFQSEIESRGQQIADRAALPTLALGAVILPMFGNSEALAILKASIGYNMRLIAPISVWNFLRIASNQSILIKDGRALEALAQIDTIVFDKTGTLTLEQPHIGAIYTCNGLSENDVLTYAAAAESNQSHPIARAILQEASTRALRLPEIDESAYEIGYGIKVAITNTWVRVGSMRFMEMEAISIPPDFHTLQANGQEQGYAFVYVAIDDHVSGAIELHATVRPEATRIIEALRQRQMSLYIISGDHAEPTHKLAEELGIDHYVAETLPEHKAAVIEQLQQEGKSVCFVGDGINDAIALSQADVSISLRGGSLIATDTARIILMDESLNRLGHLFDLADHFEINMRNNLITSVAPGVICIGGVVFLGFGLVSGIVLYTLGLVAGMTNAMLPLRRAELHNPTLHAIKP